MDMNPANPWRSQASDMLIISKSTALMTAAEDLAIIHSQQTTVSVRTAFAEQGPDADEMRASWMNMEKAGEIELAEKNLSYWNKPELVRFLLISRGWTARKPLPLLLISLTLAICMRDIVPSCILAPPERHCTTTGSWCSRPYSKARVTFSPSAHPRDPPTSNPQP